MVDLSVLDGVSSEKQTVNGETNSMDGAAQAVKPAQNNMAAKKNSEVPPPGQILTGKQEHYLKRELTSQQVEFEISELSSPTALQRFGAPFRSEFGEVSPLDSDLPILRYIFVHHVRNFPFLDHAKEKEFWQDKLQVFLESFANKHISSSEDRLEETKRRKLALKSKKLVELMMVSGIPTASGYEERIRFSEIDPIDRGAQDQGLLVNMPDGHDINGWNVNVAGVRMASEKRTQFILTVKGPDGKEIVVGRRYGDFVRLQRNLRTELPGKIFPSVPKKNKSSTSHSGPLSVARDDSSLSSVSTQDTMSIHDESSSSSLRALVDHRHSRSRNPSPVGSTEDLKKPVVLWRESQRVGLRAFIRTLLQNPQVAKTKAMNSFLTSNPIRLNEEEKGDLKRRKEMDELRIEEQRKFYEIARQRAKELDIYMERFRRDIVESNGLTKLFQEIREKEKLEDLSVQYQKFAEWLKIEIAATVYHLFLAEDNSPEIFAQAKRIHSLIPYSLLKNVIRIANPAAVMSGVLDLFLAQPFGSKSLMQRIFAMTLHDGIRTFQKPIDSLIVKINDPVFCEKLKQFCDAEEDTRNLIRDIAAEDYIDIIVAILQSDLLSPELSPQQMERAYNAYAAWNNAVENVDAEMKAGAQLFAYLKQLLKLYTRQRDKAMMLSIIEEPVTLQLFRDLFTIFYEPLVRVYKSANVYNSVTDFADFFDDLIQVVTKAQNQDLSTDPNQTVQLFIDLCARHEHNLYKFIHEVHIHDNGLFDNLMGWLEGILTFLRMGPHGGKLDMNALFQGAVDMGQVDKEKSIREINTLVKWQEERKKWHQGKTRQKMAAESHSLEIAPGQNYFRGSDFGLNEIDLQDLEIEDGINSSDEEEEDDDLDPISAERKRRARKQDHLRRTAGEPQKPEVEELHKLQASFLAMLRNVLAE
ncbi:hypothetical protein FGG08_000869 [Glutinoglossum americanum]|uniref:PX domain-containing protein n=1 Tax=Glutinoglossum americanum TaxID=1670608 RepID=A0A9P8L0W5_9PEZI|nr:hypothetical protein FGG08_000869 [Glutinoglossum americanum]